MAATKRGPEVVLADDFLVCRRESRNFALLWVAQTIWMVGGFLVLGYDRVDDQFGFPLGVPTWYLFACVVPALVFLVISIVMALRMQEVDV
jgi:putative solute:sodium symporter small subunit